MKYTLAKMPNGTFVALFEDGYAFRIGDIYASMITNTGGILGADDTPTPENHVVEERARKVIGDLTTGKVWKDTVRDLSDAVRKAERDQAAGGIAQKGRK